LGGRAALRENGTFFEFFLCSSRACLGKMLILMYKWLKKCRFLTNLLTKYVGDQALITAIVLLDAKWLHMQACSCAGTHSRERVCCLPLKTAVSSGQILVNYSY
jgi:hypothetical protein